MEDGGNNSREHKDESEGEEGEGKNARIERAVRFLRKGAISRAGKALESKRLGDMDDQDTWMQIYGKHPDRKRRISEQAYAL